MSKKQVRQMVTELTQQICDKHFLQQLELSKKSVSGIMSREYWEAQLAGKLPIKRRFTCEEILAMCEEPLKNICPEPKEGWMKFTYQYVCHILYPDPEFSVKAKPYRQGALFYLAVMRYLFDAERASLSYDPLVDFGFLEQEACGFESAREYGKFKKVFKEEFIYEMMRLNHEVTPFRTLEHIAGVHYVAMTIAGGLLAAGISIDLTLTSGAAAGHDLGKFGCKPNERVPYLHYYYTDEWFNRHDMEYIGHIAANHSTWDLEPENLSVEALVLIYSDFRVKQSRDEEGREITQISTLDGAFEVILSKLDNVDETKLRRYRFVYSKLHDFEDYMRSLGVDVNLDGHPVKPEPMPDIALRGAEQVIESLVYMGIEHNIDVMHRLGAERQFGNILEAARSEKSWKNIRAYLNIFEEYFTYTSDKQKIQTLGFLYELLMHREGDIRRQAAYLIGNVIARFNAGYRKERPANMPDIAEEAAKNLWNMYLEMLICPDHKLTRRHKARIGYNLKNVLSSMAANAAPSDIKEFLECFLEWFRYPERLDASEAFVLMDSLHSMPFEQCGEEDFGLIAGFLDYYFLHQDREVRIASCRALKLMTAYNPSHASGSRIGRLAESMEPGGDATLLFLQYRILCNLGRDTAAQQKILYGRDVVSDIFLDNLKAATPWIIKAVNIKLLLDQIDHGIHKHILHIAAHFSNLIKVSEHVAVRHEAGKALLRLAHLLTPDQCNEIAVELIKGLEVGEYEFSKYIPAYLGELALWLPPDQLDEVIEHLHGLLANTNERIASVALDTVGVLLRCYPRYPEHFSEEKEVLEARRRKMLGLLLSGLANHRESVRQEALLVIGQTVFGSGKLDDTEKSRLFALCFKKLLFLMNEYKGGELSTFYRAASLSHICRFITAYKLSRGKLKIETRDMVAFFPGTFDPFTLSHKGIVSAIRDMGFEVYLAVDEFSWSKKVQPHLIRRQIVSMSVADEFHVHLFPDNVPVNIANPSDLKRLSRVFDDKKLYIVVGSDVIANASSYKTPACEYSIHNMNHVAFRRVGDKSADSSYNREMLKQIKGEVIELELPARLEDISSTKIRENIDLNRDISNLIDPVVQEYIYHNSLYLREPEYKPILRARAISFETVKNPTQELIGMLADRILDEDVDVGAFTESVLSSKDTLLIISNVMEGDFPIGFIRARSIRPSELFNVLKRADLADLVRRHTSGDILLISGIYVGKDPSLYDTEQLLLTEAVACFLEQNCGYAMFYPYEGFTTRSVLSAIERQGFVKAPEFTEQLPLFLVDMHVPLVLVQNLETTVKEPFSSNQRVLNAIYKAHRELQTAMTKLYPGQLVLSLSAGVIHHRLVDKITALNQVPNEPVTPRHLGKYMCVPFGKILRGKVVPNTVTKTLHTDKVFEPDLSSDKIEAFPYYSPLESQIRAIKSFDRPVILVDDLLHRGGRLEALTPLLEEEKVEIKEVILGMISGYGRDNMATKGLSVDSVYFIPNLRRWFVESTLYPFVGGDTVRRDTMQGAGLMPSINMILPYTAPPLTGCSREALFELSACCIRNSRDILLVLEAEYRDLFARNLTLNRLSEAVILPLCPDKGGCVSYDLNLAASVYLDNDLEMLYRTRKMML